MSKNLSALEIGDLMAKCQKIDLFPTTHILCLSDHQKVMSRFKDIDNAFEIWDLIIAEALLIFCIQVQAVEWEGEELIF